MPVIGPGGDIHKRFFILVGLVRHEFWLHHQRPEDWSFEADADAMTLRARSQNDHQQLCILTVTEEDLLGDLGALASKFFKEHCGGSGSFDKRWRQRA